MRHILAALLVLTYFISNINCLTQVSLDLIDSVIQQSPDCTTVLYWLDSSEVNAISAKTNSPLVIIGNGSGELQESSQKVVSGRRAKCVIFFGKYNNQVINDAEYMLNETVHRTVFIFGAKLEEDRSEWDFPVYFLDSIIFVHKLLSGNLLLKNYIPYNTPERVNHMLWLRKNKTILTLDPGFSLSKNSAKMTLRNRKVVVSSIILPPYVDKLPNKKYGGVEIDIMNIMSQKIGFEFKVMEEKRWIYKDLAAHRWKGTIASVVNGSSHFATTMSPISGQLFYIHYGPQIYSQDFVYLAPKPKPIKPFNNFVRPFTTSVWLCFLTFLIGCTLLAYLLNGYHGHHHLSLGRIAFDMFGSVWQQNLASSQISPNSGFYCLIFGFWIIAMTFKGATYNCDLRAFIVKIEYEKPIETDLDLLERNADPYIAAGTGLLRVAFRLSESPVKRELYNRVVQHSTELYATDVIGPTEERMVKEGGARFAVKTRAPLIMAAFEKHYGYQPLRETKTISYSNPITLAMEKYQPWNEESDKILLHILAGGFVDILTRRNLPFSKYTQSHVNANKEEKIEPYKIEHVAGPLIVLGAGLVLSILLFVFERVYDLFVNHKVRVKTIVVHAA